MSESQGRARSRLTWRVLGGVGVVAIVVGLVWLVQAMAWLQPIELWFHDRMVAWRARVVAWQNPDAAHDPRIVIVAVTAADLAAIDYPLTDESLARLIERIVEGKPRAVGVDLYRDLPVPRSGSGTPALQAAFEKNPSVVAAFFFGPERVQPPAFLVEKPDQLAFNDFPFDGRMVRRGLLYVDDGETAWFSFAARLAMLYLQHENPPREFGDAPGHAGWVRLGEAAIPRFHHTDGAYVRADDRGYQFFLDFCGPGPGNFAAYSVKDTLDGRTPAEAFRDKIVLIGAGDRSLNDAPVIPLLPVLAAEGGAGAAARPAAVNRLPRLQTPGEIFGVELHAAVVNQLLRLALENAKPSRTWSSAGELAWIFAAGLLGGVAGFVVRCPWRLLISLGLLAFVFVALGLWLFVDRLWVPIAAPLAAALFSAVLVNSNEGGQEDRDRRQLMSLFARNLSPAVAESLWEQREDFAANNRPKPRELTVTVLFTDLAGFSTVAEEMQPAELMDWLNEYLELMAQRVEARGGVVLKYMGDALMAAFGVPLPSTGDAAIARDASAAIRAALDMQAELAGLNARRTQAGRQRTRMRVGIFTGDVVAGCLGSANRLEYTMIGDTVNTASRLETWDKDYDDADDPIGDCRILIGESTQALVAHEFRTKRVGEIRLKGKERTTTIHRVLGTQ